MTFAKQRWHKAGNIILALVIFILLTVSGIVPVTTAIAGGATSITRTIQPSSADSEIYQQSAASNYGTKITLQTDPWNAALIRRGLVQFDISSIPSGSAVTSATLSLKESAAQGATRTINVHRITSNWTESGVTWNSRNGADNWATSGGDFDSTATNSQNITWTGGSKDGLMDCYHRCIQLCNRCPV